MAGDGEETAVRRCPAVILLLLCSTFVPVQAADKLVLDVNIDTDRCP